MSTKKKRKGKPQKPYTVQELRLKQEFVGANSKYLCLVDLDRNEELLTEEWVASLKGKAGLLFESEGPFLDSVLKQLRDRVPLTEKQVSWVGKIAARERRVEARLEQPVTVRVVGGFR